MSIRMTPIVALAMALSLSACQDEEESPDATQTEQPAEAEGMGSADVDVTDEEVTTEAAGDGTPEAAEVERETTATGDASQDATENALDAARDGENPTTAADAPAAEEGAVGAEADGETSLEEVLTPEGFDADRIVAAIENSDLDETRKDDLRVLTRAAEDDPTARDAAIGTLRAELLGEDGADAGDITGTDFAAGPGSLFAPERFGDPSTFGIEGARLAGMRTAIFAEPGTAAD